MKERISRLVTLAVLSAGLLSGCTGRMILHGSKPSRPDVNKPAVTVWFVRSNDNGMALASVNRRLPSSTSDRLEFALRQLMDGPSTSESQSGLASEIPRGTILLDVKHGSGTAEVNVSQRFATGDGTSSLEMRLEQLRKTVAGAAGNTAVYLNVEGKRLNVAGGEGIEVHQPINK